MGKVSVIIVNYNSGAVIMDCLAALERQSFDDFETIVVDNGSTDQSMAEVMRRFPGVRGLPLNENRGFTGGNAAGLAISKGEYICLLNPDTVPADDWLAHLTRGLDEHPEAGACASRLMVYGSDQIDSAGDGCTVTGKGFKRGEGKIYGPDFSKSGYVFGACGGAMLIRRKVIEEIGFLDEDFFLIFEDTDFCLRMQMAGWKCWYAADAEVGHKVRSSIGVLSDIAVYYSIRNGKYLVIQNMPGGLIWRNLFSYLVQEIGIFCYFVIKHKKWKLYWCAHRDVWKAWPALQEKRKRLLAASKISDQELEGQLVSLWTRDLLREKMGKLWGGFGGGDV